MVREYKGILIEEGLENREALCDFEILKSETTDEEDLTQCWHLHTVKASKEDIERLSLKIKDGWYAHFWKGHDVVVVFKDKKFEFNFDDKSSWKPAVDYGVSLGIPKEELDFPID